MKQPGKFFKTNLPNTSHLYTIGVGLTAALILLIPLVAMQITDEVVWNLADFVVAWTLLFGAGLTYNLVARKMDNIAYRAAVGVAVVTSLIIIWSNLAVGLIGNEDNLINLIYFFVLLLGIIGALIARFRANSMAFVLFSMALALVLIAAFVLIADLQQDEFTVVKNLVFLGVHCFFATMFVISALLFRYAAREPQIVKTTSKDQPEH
jgi:uncharacterized membrane protein YwaF